jgi:hypothetical protein
VPVIDITTIVKIATCKLPFPTICFRAGLPFPSHS